MKRIQVVITSEAYVERSTVHFSFMHMYCVPGDYLQCMEICPVINSKQSKNDQA